MASTAPVAPVTATTNRCGRGGASRRPVLGVEEERLAALGVTNAVSNASTSEDEGEAGSSGREQPVRLLELREDAILL